jgi:pyruvate dehydrogenase E1 component alpha subunit
LPVIYLCENNGYAIRTSLARSHGQPNIAKRADSYGMTGVTVDGQDVRAVYNETNIAAMRARGGEGPTLIEAKTYRFDERNVGLFVPMPYRPADEVSKYKTQLDPITLFRQVLLHDGSNEGDLKAIEDEVTHEVEQATRFAEESPQPDRESLHEYLYSQPITSGTPNRIETP